jgi:hypothetical protein
MKTFWIYFWFPWDPLISSLRKLPKNATKTCSPEALKLYAVPKESEHLFSSDIITTQGDLVTLQKKLPIALIEGKEYYIIMKLLCVFMSTV